MEYNVWRKIYNLTECLLYLLVVAKTALVLYDRLKALTSFFQNFFLLKERWEWWCFGNLKEDIFECSFDSNWFFLTRSKSIDIPELFIFQLGYCWFDSLPFRNCFQYNYYDSGIPHIMHHLNKSLHFSTYTFISLPKSIYPLL